MVSQFEKKSTNNQMYLLISLIKESATSKLSRPFSANINLSLSLSPPAEHRTTQRSMQNTFSARS